MDLITDPEIRFTVELRSVACEHCQSGAEYVIVDHVEDCELLCMSWGTEEDAWGYHAAILAGYSAGLSMLSPAVTALLEAVGSVLSIDESHLYHRQEVYSKAFVALEAAAKAVRKERGE